MRHVNSVMERFYAVDALDNTAGSRIGILRTLAHIIKRLLPALNANRHFFLVSDFAVAHKVKAMIFTVTRWEQEGEGNELRASDVLGHVNDDDPFLERLERARRLLRECQQQLPFGAQSQKHLVADMNKELAAAHQEELLSAEQPEEGELPPEQEQAAAPTVDAGTLSKFLRRKHNYKGQFLALAEKYLERKLGHALGGEIEALGGELQVPGEDELSDDDQAMEDAMPAFEEEEHAAADAGDDDDDDDDYIDAAATAGGKASVPDAAATADAAGVTDEADAAATVAMAAAAAAADAAAEPAADDDDTFEDADDAAVDAEAASAEGAGAEPPSADADEVFVDAQDNLEPQLTLVQLRELMERYEFVFEDLFHPGLHMCKQLYETFRECFFRPFFATVFPKGKALPHRKLVTIRFVMLLLRLACTSDVRKAVREWYDDGLATGVSDPRAQALYALLFFYVPLVALWERAALQGPVDTLVKIAPLMAMVRVLSSGPYHALTSSLAARADAQPRAGVRPPWLSALHQSFGCPHVRHAAPEDGAPCRGQDA